MIIEALVILPNLNRRIILVLKLVNIPNIAMNEIMELIDTMTVQFNNFHFFENGNKQIEEVNVIATANTT